MSNNMNLARKRPGSGSGRTAGARLPRPKTRLSSREADRASRPRPVLVESDTARQLRRVPSTRGARVDRSADEEFERKRRRAPRDEANIDIYTLYAREMGGVPLLTPE